MISHRNVAHKQLEFVGGILTTSQNMRGNIMRYISNHTSAREFISARREFNGSSMSGRKTPTGDVGRLPGNWRDVYYQTAGRIDYIIYSFSTPIAWHTNDGLWIIPSVTYSSYSSRHQHYARMVAMAENSPWERIEADRYYHSHEIMRSVSEYRATGKAFPMETNRSYAYVTIRGIKRGDYIMTECGIWERVYDLERVNGVLGRKYWRAVTVHKGARERTYIGDNTERVGRLR